MKILDVLTEIIWEEHFSAMKAAKKFPYDWIHFTMIPKLGVNPQKTHRDPPGIYFYPIRWLLSYDAGLSQYATHYPYYYICRIAHSRNSINLSRMTTKQSQTIAQRNGWLEDFHRVVNSGVLRHPDTPIRQIDPKLLRKPGGLFYTVADYLVNVENRSWLQLLKGVDALYDNGSGIISGGEEYQAVVINRSLIKVLDHGSNKDEFDQVHAEMMKQLAQEVGGTFYYRHKLPTLEVNGANGPVKMIFDAGNWRMIFEYFRNGHWFRETQKYESPSQGDFESVLRSLRYYLGRAMDRASPANPNNYWTGERILNLYHSIYNPKATVSAYERDGQIGYAARWEGLFWTALYMKPLQDGSLHIEGHIAGGLEKETLMELDMVIQPGQETTVIPQIKNHVWQQLKANLPKVNWDVAEPRILQSIMFQLPTQAA